MWKVLVQAKVLTPCRDTKLLVRLNEGYHNNTELLKMRLCQRKIGTCLIKLSRSRLRMKMTNTLLVSGVLHVPLTVMTAYARK